MKIVIDISKEMYQECIETVASLTAHYESYEFHRMVQNGTLFDSVLEDIKAEIKQEYNSLRATRADETLELGECLGLKMSLKIIENHISGKENNK